MSPRCASLLLIVFAASGCVASPGAQDIGPTGPADGLGTLASPYILRSEADQRRFFSYLDNRTHDDIQCRTERGTDLSVTFPGKNGACTGTKRISYLDGSAYWTCVPNVLTDFDEKYDFEHGIFSWRCGDEQLEGPVGVSPDHDFWDIIVIGTTNGYRHWASCETNGVVGSDPPSESCQPLPADWSSMSYANRAHWAQVALRKARWCGELIAYTDLGYAESWGNRAVACTHFEADCLAAVTAVAQSEQVGDSNACR